MTLQSFFQGDIGSFAQIFPTRKFMRDLQKYIQLTSTSEPKVFDLFIIISPGSQQIFNDANCKPTT